MTQTSAPAKITRPKPHGVLARPRLVRLLDEARTRRIIWITAPPGAGKTTLVSDYLERRKLKNFWYQVDGGDADFAALFYYLGLAGGKVATRARKPLPQLAPEHGSNLDSFFRLFFQELFGRWKAPHALVFDNYQELPEDAVFHNAVIEAFRQLPADSNIIVLSRNDPPPVFARAQVNGLVARIDWHQLKLTSAEANRLIDLKKRRSTLSAALRKHIYATCDGWMAGLLLLLETLTTQESAEPQLREFAPQVLFDYFGSQIFDRMDERVKEVLVHSAFLPKMTLQAVQQLSGVPNAGRAIQDLHRRNYFIVRHGDDPPVYQYHPLFRTFLLNRAPGMFRPARLKAIMQCAATLLAESGQFEDAVNLYRQIQDERGIIEIIVRHAPSLMKQGRTETILSWIHALSEETVQHASWVLYWLGMCRLAFDPVEARGHFEKAFRLFEQDGDVAGLFTAWASIVDTFGFERGEFAPLDRWIGMLDELLVRHSGFPSPEIEARVASSMFMALMYRQPQRPDLPQWVERVRAIVLKTSDVRTQMTLGNQLVHYYNSWLGDLASARIVIEAIRRPANAADVGPIAHLAWCAMEADYHWHVGAHGECLRVVNEGLETIRQTGVLFMNSLLKSHGVMAGLMAEDFPAAEQLLKSATAAISGGRLLFRSRYYYMTALSAFYQKDTLHALASAREAVAHADGSGVPICQALYRLGLARILFSLGQRREALSCLGQAQRIARRTNIAHVRFSCLAVASYFLLERGKHRLAVPLLRKVLETARQRGHISLAFWTSEFMTRLFAAALEHGIEVEYVQGAIRRHKLAPPAEALHLEHWPLAVRLYTLGRFSVLIDGKPLQFSGKAQRKPLELLMALVAFGGRDVSESQLTETLWPDSEGDAAHEACAAALHRLRKLLGCDAAVSLQRNLFSLDPRYVWVDIWAFERWLGPAQNPAGAAGQRFSERAMALYQGPFLGKHMDLSWAMPLRERLRAKFLRHLTQCGQGLFDAGEFKPAITVLERGLNVDPLAEDCYRNLMLCYQALDRRAEAIGVYQRCQKTLAATLGVRPAPEIVALYQTLQG